MAVTTADINSLTSSIENLVRSISSQSRFSTGPQGAGGDNASRLLARREKHNVKIFENIVKSTRDSAHALKEIEKISDKETKLSLKMIRANSQLEKVMEKAYEDGRSGRRVLERLPEGFKNAMAGSKIFSDLQKKIEAKDILSKMELSNKEGKLSDTNYKAYTNYLNNLLGDEFKGLSEESINYKMSIEEAQKSLEGMSSDVKSLSGQSGLLTIMHSMDNLKEIIDEMETMSEFTDKITEKELDKFAKQLGPFGNKFKEMIKTSNTFEEAVKKSKDALNDMADAVNKSSDNADSGEGILGKMLGMSKKGFAGLKSLKGGIAGFLAGELFGTLKQFAKDFGDEVGTQMKFGYSIPMKDFPDIALKFGMNIKEAAEFLGKQRDVMNVRNLGEKEYMRILEDGSKTLMNYIGDQSEATKAYANTIRDTRRFGVATIDSAAAAQRQTDLFKESFAPLGVLHEGFEDLRESVLSNEGNMVTLGALQRDQREEFILGIQKQHEYYLALGFNIDQTKRATEVLSALAKESPLERMKKGASLGAMMGMAGMGGEGTRMQDYMKRFHTLTPEERKDLQEMKTEVANRFTQMYGDQQGGILFEQMAHQQGWAGEFATLESITKEGMTADEKRAKEESDRHKKRTEKFEESLTYLKAIEAASNSSVGLLGMLAIKAGTGLLGKDSKWITTIEKFTGHVLKGEFDQILPKSRTSTETGRLDMRQTGEQNRLSFLSQNLADLNKEREKKINEAGEIAVGKGTIRLSNEDTLKRTKDIEEKYQKEKEELLENMNKTLKNLEYYNKQSTELQKKGNQAADKTKDNTDKTAKELEAQNEKAKDLNKIYQMKISRVSSAPTN